MEFSVFITRAPFDTALASLGLKLAGVDSLPFLLPSGTQLPVQFARPGSTRRRLLQLEQIDDQVALRRSWRQHQHQKQGQKLRKAMGGSGMGGMMPGVKKMRGRGGR